MNNYNNKNSMFIVATGIILSIGRFLLGMIDKASEDSKAILVVMALVNYIALGVVFLFLYNEFYKKCRNKIDSSGVTTSIKKKSKKVITIFSAILTIVYLLVGIIYVAWLKTSDLNDVISILALSVSIATNGLIDNYGDDFYKLVLRITKFSLKPKKEQEKT